MVETIDIHLTPEQMMTFYRCMMAAMLQVCERLPMRDADSDILLGASAVWRETLGPIEEYHLDEWAENTAKLMKEVAARER